MSVIAVLNFIQWILFIVIPAGLADAARIASVAAALSIQLFALLVGSIGRHAYDTASTVTSAAQLSIETVATSSISKQSMALPGILLLGHYAIHFMLRPVPVDRFLWTCFSVASLISWLYVFRSVMPFGRIDFQLLEAESWESDTLLNACRLFSVFFVVSLCYHVLTVVTSNAWGQWSHLWRKSIPFIVILLLIASPIPPMPSQVLNTVAWLLRYLLADTFTDVMLQVADMLHESYGSSPSWARGISESRLNVLLVLMYSTSVAGWTLVVHEAFNVYHIESVRLVAFCILTGVMSTSRCVFLRPRNHRSEVSGVGLQRL